MMEQARKWAGPVRSLTPTELADHHAIAQLCQIYALGMDMRDYELARSAFAADAQIAGKQGLEPVDESLPKTYAIAASFASTQHFIGNQYVDLAGDEAVAWSYGIAHHKVRNGTDQDEIIAGVQYLDRCRRDAGGWAIVERSINNLWVDMKPRNSKI